MAAPLHQTLGIISGGEETSNISTSLTLHAAKFALREDSVVQRTARKRHIVNPFTRRSASGFTHTGRPSQLADDSSHREPGWIASLWSRRQSCRASTVRLLSFDAASRLQNEAICSTCNAPRPFRTGPRTGRRVARQVYLWPELTIAAEVRRWAARAADSNVALTDSTRSRIRYTRRSHRSWRTTVRQCWRPARSQR